MTTHTFGPDRDGRPLRVLFCIGVMPEFFALDDADREEVFDAIVEGFDDLSGRFGVHVLGTLDDDQTMVGAAVSFPWTCYILADAPDLAAVREVCNVLRATRVGGSRLWRYLRVEARVGRQLFFGNA